MKTDKFSSVTEKMQKYAGKPLTLAVVVLASITLGQQAHALIIPTWTESLTEANPYSVSGTDLVNTGQPTYSNIALTSGSEDYGSSKDALNNGLVDGDISGVGFAPMTTVGPVVVTFTLDLTLHPSGYNISEIVSLAGYVDARRAIQKYDVAVHTAGAAPLDFALLSSVVNLGANSGAPGWTQVTIGDGSTFIATGVDQIQFTFNNTYGSGGITESFYREIDVFGSGSATTVPEPAIGLLLLTGFGLWRWKRAANR